MSEMHTRQKKELEKPCQQRASQASGFPWALEFRISGSTVGFRKGALHDLRPYGNFPKVGGGGDAKIL